MSGDAFETTHRVLVDDARSLDLPDDSVELVVTSPPYPMIEMWDGVFADLDPAVGEALEAGDSDAAFEAMHELLDGVWAEVARVLAPGGIAAVNVGDAARKLDDAFRLYPNRVAVTDAVTDHGLSPLPGITWRKPANSAADFMGSGMLPPNAYVTLEHEAILLFRNGGLRSFPPGDRRRYESAYFWEERNEWFSDLWTDVRGVDQALPESGRRDRSAAFPLALPYRLIAMFSTYGDTVLDPFLGTGTTSLAALVAGRESVGYELDADLAAALDERIGDAPALSRKLVADRLDAHRAFAAENPDRVSYEATHYDFGVVTKQERDLRLYAVEGVEETPDGYRARHAPI
ncbi:MAG: site-specific DNA-methyltransferase [Halobacteriales archaeon]